MTVQNHNNRILEYPSQGQLLVAADLHGNREDFDRVKEIFLEKSAENEQTYLLFLGDLVHGPKIGEEYVTFPTYLDESEYIVDGVMELMQTGRVHSLLGNHEHGHIGGPHTSKFWSDEVENLEKVLSHGKKDLFNQFFRTMPLIALTNAGVSFSHGAPSESIKSLDEILKVKYEGHEHKSMSAMYDVDVLDHLWCRGASDETMVNYLKVISQFGKSINVVVQGHEIADGFYIENIALGVLGTSFAVDERNKRMLSIDLASWYHDVNSFKDDNELIRLYPPSEVHLLAKTAFDRGNYNAAIHMLDDACESADDFLLLGKVHLGIYLKSNETISLDSAYRNLHQANAIDPSDADVHFTIGKTLTLMGEKQIDVKKKNKIYQQAIRHFRSADTYNFKLGPESRLKIAELKGKLVF